MQSNEIDYILNLRKVSLHQIEVGRKTYGSINAYGFGNCDEQLKIGNFCSIAENVYFLLGGEHRYDTLSTFPFKNKYFGKLEARSKGKIVIEDDVWIGFNCIIMSGVHIGQGAIISAGTIVSEDVPPYAIYTTKRIIKYRFSKEIIQKLLKFNYASVSDKEIIENIDILTKEIDNSFFETELYKNHRRIEK